MRLGLFEVLLHERGKDDKDLLAQAVQIVLVPFLHLPVLKEVHKCVKGDVVVLIALIKTTKSSA